MTRTAAINDLDTQIDALTAIRAEVDARAKACLDRDLAAYLREDAARLTGAIARARADRSAINY